MVVNALACDKLSHATIYLQKHLIGNFSLNARVGDLYL